MESFRRSFDRVYGMKPDMLQLGFLKVLKGTKIRRDAGKHGYRYRNYPPYEILYNSYIGFDEILELKGMEDLVGRYYNSGRFVKTLDYLTNRYFGSAFDFFRAFNRFSLETGRKGTPAALKELYGALYCFAASFADGEGLSAANEFMKLDFLASDSSGCLPPVLIRDLPDGFRDICFGFLKDRRNIERYLPEFTGLPAKEIYKKVHFEPFSIDITQTGYIAFSEKPLVLLFDYSSRDRVSGLFHYDLIYI